MPPPRRAPKPATPPTELQHQSVQEGQPPAPPSLPPPTEAQFSWVPLADVKKWDKNPRDNRAAIPKVAASIRRFGVVSAPVVWTSQGRLVAGHTRVAAMELILSTDPEFVPVGAPAGTRPGLVPIRFHEFASEAEATAYAIADNRLGELAQWDTEKLPELLGGLDATLVTLTGFSVPALDASFVPPTPEALSGGRTNAEAEWASAGMPGMESEDRWGHRSLIIHFATEDDFRAFLALTGLKATEKTKYAWFPPKDPGVEKEVGRFSDRHYERAE